MRHLTHLSLFALLLALLSGCAAPTVSSTPPPNITPASPDVQISQIQSAYHDFYFGQGKGEPGVVFIGHIIGPSFEANNPGYLIPQFDGVHESRLNYLYSQDNPDQTAGFLIDNNYLMQIFKATESKGEAIGTLPDGTTVEYKNGLWEAVIDGKTKFFNPLFAGQYGKPFGYPVFADDNQGNFYTGQCLDENGVLVAGTKMEPAFKTPGQLAWEAGYEGDLAKVGRVELNGWGNIVVYDALGNQLSVQPYLNPKAPAESFETPTPNAEATKQAEFEAKKAEALKMVSIKLDSPEDFATLPVLDDVADFDSGKVQEVEHWLIDNVLPAADIKLPDSWRVQTGDTTGFCNMMYDLNSEGNIDIYRGVASFFVKRDGKQMLRIAVQYGGGKDQVIYFNFEDPKWWTDPVYMKTLIATFHHTTDVVMFPMIQYGTLNNNQLRQEDGYMMMLDASNTESYSKKKALDRSIQFANDWASNRQLPEGADRTVFGARFFVFVK